MKKKQNAPGYRTETSPQTVETLKRKQEMQKTKIQKKNLSATIQHDTFIASENPEEAVEHIPLRNDELGTSVNTFMEYTDDLRKNPQHIKQRARSILTEYHKRHGTMLEENREGSKESKSYLAKASEQRAVTDLKTRINRRIDASLEWLNMDDPRARKRKEKDSYLRINTGALDIDNDVYGDAKALEGIPDPESKLMYQTLTQLALLVRGEQAGKFLCPEQVVADCCRDPESVKGAAQMLIVGGLALLASIAVIRNVFDKKFHWTTAAFLIAVAIAANPKRFMNSFSKSGVVENLKEDIAFLNSRNFNRIMGFTGSKTYAESIMSLSSSKLGRLETLLAKHHKKDSQVTMQELTGEEEKGSTSDTYNKRGKPIGIDDGLARWLMSLPPWDAWYIVSTLRSGSGSSKKARFIQESTTNYLAKTSDPDALKEAKPYIAIDAGEAETDI